MVDTQLNSKLKIKQYVMNNQECLQWIADLFEESVEDLRPETSRDDILAWDSLGSLTLIAGMDDDFGILLNDEDIQGMKKVNDILVILQKNGKIS